MSEAAAVGMLAASIVGDALGGGVAVGHGVAVGNAVTVGKGVPDAGTSHPVRRTLSARSHIRRILRWFIFTSHRGQQIANSLLIKGAVLEPESVERPSHAAL